MLNKLLTAAVAVSSLLTHAYAGEKSVEKELVPPADDSWRFLLAVPGWMAGVDGTVGIHGANSHVDLGFNTILPRLDMIWATRVEVSTGRFGMLGELVYLSMSDGMDTGTVIKKVDVGLDEYLGDFTLRYRL